MSGGAPIGGPRLLGEVEAGAARQRAQHQPTLVERAAGDADRFALEIGDRGDGRGLGRHHRAERGGIGGEQEIVAERPLARHPQPVRDDHVDRAAAQRDLAGLGRGELLDLNVEIGRLVEPARLGDGELPGDGAGPLHGDAQRIGGEGGVDN